MTLSFRKILMFQIFLKTENTKKDSLSLENML